jgi:lipoate-protein ligase A
MIETWRLISGPPYESAASGPGGEPAYHMAVDEAVAMAFLEGNAPPTLRIYRWNAPAVTIGRFQSPDEIDWDACRRLEIPVVRRITGGSAVLHGTDLTYGVVGGGETSLFRHRAVKETYLMISRALLQALERLGLDARPVQSPPRRGSVPQCFGSPSWHEISVNGRKVVGSAQKRWRAAFLQQGSFPLEFNPEAVCRVFRFAGEEDRRAAEINLAGKACGLSDCEAGPVRFEALKQAVIAGMEEILGIRLTGGTLSPPERETAVRLARGKYSQIQWNLSGKAGPEKV